MTDVKFKQKYDPEVDGYYDVERYGSLDETLRDELPSSMRDISLAIEFVNHAKAAGFRRGQV